MARLALNGITVDFPVFGTKIKRSLLGSVANAATRGRIGRSPQGGVVVRALQAVSLKLEEGDRLGIIGPNGSGKSTLLRVMGGLLHPTSGMVDYEGRRLALLTLSMGLDADRTGYQNIEYMARLYGMNRAQRAQLRSDVEAFTDLGNFLSLPVDTYSSGMMVRLAFAVATSIRRDILLLDEVTAVGDYAFHNKAHERLVNMGAQARILAIATHSPDVLFGFCNRAVYMSGGQIQMMGTPEDAWRAYTRAASVQAA